MYMDKSNDAAPNIKLIYSEIVLSFSYSKNKSEQKQI